MRNGSAGAISPRERACARADLDELVKRHEVAAERARLLERRHLDNGNPPDHNPSSSVWRLIDVVRQV